VAAEILEEKNDRLKKMLGKIVSKEFINFQILSHVILAICESFIQDLQTNTNPIIP
jgi:hypothetical protein